MAALRGLFDTARGWLAYSLVRAGLVIMGEPPHEDRSSWKSPEESGEQPPEAVTMSAKAAEMVRPPHRRTEPAPKPAPLRGSIEERVLNARRGSR